MDDKKNKKIIGYDANTGFPIYEINNNQTIVPNTFIDYKNIKAKYSFLTILSIIFLGLSIFLLVGGTAWCILSAKASSDSGADAYAWAMFFIWIISIHLIVFYIFLTVVGINTDKRNTALRKKSSKLNIFIRTILLFGPFLIVGVHCLSYYINYYTKHNIRIGDIKMTIPAGSGKSSYTLSLDGKSRYSLLGYSSNNCLVVLEYNKNEKDEFIDSFIEYAGYEINIDIADKPVIKNNLNKKDINGRTWLYYEKETKSYIYRNYGLVIDDYFYTMLLRESSKNACDDYFEKVFNSVKYVD